MRAVEREDERSRVEPVCGAAKGLGEQASGRRGVEALCGGLGLKLPGALAGLGVGV